MTWHTIIHPDTSITTTNDADKIIEAYKEGALIERIPAPPESCGCPRCRVAAGELVEAS